MTLGGRGQKRRESAEGWKIGQRRLIRQVLLFCELQAEKAIETGV